MAGCAAAVFHVFLTVASPDPCAAVHTIATDACFVAAAIEQASLPSAWSSTRCRCGSRHRRDTEPAMTETVQLFRRFHRAVRYALPQRNAIVAILALT